MRPRRSRRVAAALTACGALLTAPADAQHIPAPALRAPVASPRPAAVLGPSDGALRTPEETAAPRRRAPLWAPAASLVVPGAGQLAMRQARGVAYLAGEIYTIIQLAEHARTARRSRREYRRTAREVARFAFGGTADGPWEYYEGIYDFPASGRFSTTADGVTPESDPRTFNGAEWLRSSEIYDCRPEDPRTDPRCQRALASYTERAVKDGFLWSWGEQQLQWDLYKGAIERENRATRNLTTTLFVLGANHLVSGIDALATVRLRRFSTPAGADGVGASIPWPRLRGGR